MAAWTACSFRYFSCCLKCSKLCNWYFQRWNCESSDRRTKESNLFCFIGPRYICLPSNYGKSLNYQVSPAKTGLISRGENHSLSWQFLHMRDRKRVRSRQSLAEVSSPSSSQHKETSARRELIARFCLICLLNCKILVHCIAQSTKIGQLFLWEFLEYL
jgi:hypothetical protein